MEDDSIWITALAYFVMLIVPAIFLLTGAMVTVRSLKFMAGARKTDGKVVDCVKIHSIGAKKIDQTSYKLTYEYTGTNGTPIQGELYTRGSYPSAIGHVEEILVNPEKDKMVRRPGLSNYTMGPILLALGLASLIPIAILKGFI